MKYFVDDYIASELGYSRNDLSLSDFVCESDLSSVTDAVVHGDAWVDAFVMHADGRVSCRRLRVLCHGPDRAVTIEPVPSNMSEFSFEAARVTPLLRSIAAVCNADYIGYGALDGARMTTRGWLVAGEPQPDIGCDLDGTPCIETIKNGEHAVRRDVQKLYVKDTCLVEMGVHAYFGVAVRDCDGLVIGLVIAMFRQPHEGADVLPLLKIAADFLSAEFDRAQSELDLRIANERFTIASQAAKIGVWEYDLRRREFVIDDHAVMKHQRLRDIRLWADVVHPEDRDRVLEAFTQAIASRSDYASSMRVLTPDGAIRYIESFGRPIVENGEVVHVMGANVHPEDVERASAEIRSVPETSRASTSFRVVQPGGEVSHVTSYARSATERHSHASRLIGLCIDVTAQKQTELRERGRNRVLEALISSASVTDVLAVLVNTIEEEEASVRVGFMLVHPNGRLLVNAAAPSLPDEYLKAVDHLMIRVGNGSCGSSAALKTPVIVEDVMNHPYWDAFHEYAELAGFRACWSIPILGQNDQVYGTLAVYFRDVKKADPVLLRRFTEAADFASLAIAKKNAERDLKNSEMLLQTTGKIAGVGGWEIDLRHRTRQWTEQMYRIFGLKPDEPIPDDLMHHYSPGSRARILAGLETVKTTGEPMDLDLEIYTSSGEHKWVRAEGRAEIEDGVPVKLIGALQDITAQKEAELDRERLQEQLLHAQKMESIGRLAGGVAHDFNNILSVILGHAELATEDVDPDTMVANDLNEIRIAAERSAGLTRQLLAFARKQPIAPCAVNINSTISSMVNMLRRLIGERIRLTWHAQPDLWDVYVDPAQVDQVLVNLCINARDAIEGAGEVTIETRNVTLTADDILSAEDCEPGEYVRLSVQDTGRGIPDELLAQVFEPFFTTKAVGAGIGLGLATVYGILKQNRGWVDVSSILDDGTTFYLYFPRLIADLAEASNVVSEVTADTHHSILLVEDEPALLKLATRMLEGLGHSVVPASGPRQALVLVQEHPEIEILVTDVIMPDMNGRDLAIKIKQLRPEIRHVFMSGYTAEVMELEGILEAGEFFLQKPFTLAQLEATLRNVFANLTASRT